MNLETAKDLEIKVSRININLITEGYSPRKDFRRKENLRRSIERDGLLVPLTVRKDGDKYVIIYGVMRFRVVRELGWEEVDCIIIDADEETSYHLAYVENMERQNLNPIEDALHLKTMQEKFGYNVEDLVRKGYAPHRSTLDDKLSLLTLPEEIQREITEGTVIGPSIGYELAKLSDEKSQKDLAQEIIASGGMSVRKVKEKVESLNVQRKSQEKETHREVKIPQGDIPGVFFKDSSDMSELPDESVGLVVTSPPYWVGMEYEEGVSFEDHLKMLERVLSECVRVLVPGGKIAINFADIHTFGTKNGGKPEVKLMGHHYVEILGKHGLRLLDPITWKKRHPGKKDANWFTNPQVTYHSRVRHGTYRFLRNTEHIFIFEKDGDAGRTYPPQISKEEWTEWVDAVWEIPPVKNQKDHPAQFPEEIPRRLIRMFSCKGEIVLDPFLGSGTTNKVARDLDRVGIGYEKDEKYKSAIMKKLGVKEEDLKKEERREVSPKSTDEERREAMRKVRNDFFPQVLAETMEKGEEITRISVILKPNLKKDDVTVETAPLDDDPSPTSPIPFPLLGKSDDYEGTGELLLGKSSAEPQGPIPIPNTKGDISPHLNRVILGDCLEKLKDIPDNSVDVLITDPPDGIHFMGKDWDKAGPKVEVWKQSLRVLKPGAVVFIMCLPRQDCLSRMILNLAEAGFDTNFTSLYWTYAQAFPKAHSISKAIDKKLGLEREVLEEHPLTKQGFFDKVNEKGRWYHQSENQGCKIYKYKGITKPACELSKKFDGSYAGFQPKPAVEIIIVAQKPITKPTFTDQALDNGNGITWMDDCRIPNPSEKEKCQNEDRAIRNDRFPSNLIVSDDVLGEHSRFFSLDAWAEKYLPFLIVPKPSKREKGKGNTHPTVKPIKLMAYLVTMGSREGDVVLDCFAGSGTTCVAAQMLNRKFIGIELDKEYHAIAVKKVEGVAMAKAA
jgi:ParB/RepB/Spo0J family partition protein